MTDDAQRPSGTEQIDEGRPAATHVTAAGRDADPAALDDGDRVFKRRIDCAPGRGTRSWPGGRHR